MNWPCTLGDARLAVSAVMTSCPRWGVSRRTHRHPPPNHRSGEAGPEKAGLHALRKADALCVLRRLQRLPARRRLAGLSGRRGAATKHNREWSADECLSPQAGRWWGIPKLDQGRTQERGRWPALILSLWAGQLFRTIVRGTGQLSARPLPPGQRLGDGATPRSSRQRRQGT